MPRCPTYLNVDDFDKLAETMGLSLTDDGVSAIGEIAELIAQQILENAKVVAGDHPFNIQEIISAATDLCIKIDVDWERKKVIKASIGE